MTTIGQRLIEALGGATEEQLKALENRAYEAGFFDGNDDPPSGDLASLGYRRSTQGGLRDFTKMTPEEIHNTVWELWQSSPIAKRIMTLKRDHIIGVNTIPESDSEDLTEIIDEFWEINKMEQRASEFTLQLFLWGEQIFPTFVREADGRVKIGYIDPAGVSKVIKHPANTLEDFAIVTGDTPGNQRVYRIVREDEEYFDGEKVVPAVNPDRLVLWQQANLQTWENELLQEHDRQQYDGTVFFFGVNRLSNQPRGYSDLVQLADWIDQADATLWAMAEREQFAGYFSFDITLNDADATEVSARAKELRKNPPARGSVNVHNDQETWLMHAPDLKQAASIASFIAQMTNIMGGAGFPLAWYGYGDDTNRATLGEQATPSEKSLEHDQAIVEGMFLFMLRFVKDQAIIASKYTENEKVDDTIRVDLPELRSEDLATVAQSFAPLVNALTMAKDTSLITNETAARTFHRALANMGIDVDTTQEIIDAEEQSQDDIIEETEKDTAKLQKAFGINGNG